MGYTVFKWYSIVYLISQDLYLFFELVNQSLRLHVWQEALSCLQFFFKARDVVLSKPDNHSAGMDELVFLGPCLLKLSHLLEQHLNVTYYCKFLCTSISSSQQRKFQREITMQNNISHTPFSSSRFLHRRRAAINFALYETSCWLSMDGTDEKSLFTLCNIPENICLKTCNFAYNTCNSSLSYCI